MLRIHQNLYTNAIVREIDGDIDRSHPIKDRDTAALMFIREKELDIQVRQKPVAVKSAA